MFYSNQYFLTVYAINMSGVRKICITLVDDEDGFAIKGCHISSLCSLYF